MSVEETLARRPPVASRLVKTTRGQPAGCTASPCGGLNQSHTWLAEPGPEGCQARQTGLDGFTWQPRITAVPDHCLPSSGLTSLSGGGRTLPCREVGLEDPRDLPLSFPEPWFLLPRGESHDKLNHLKGTIALSPFTMLLNHLYPVPDHSYRPALD